jgi:hypothetical protein
MRSFRFLFHKNFNDQINNIISQLPPSKQEKFKEQLRTSLKKIKSNPNSSRILKGINKECLKGVVRRIHVGGNNGRRLVFLYLHEDFLIIPTTITKEIRANINYNRIPWEKISNEIYDDFIRKNYEAFVNWQP